MPHVDLDRKPLIDSAEALAGAPDARDLLAQSFRDFARTPSFPCEIAKGTVAQNRLAAHVYDDLRCPRSSGLLLDDLYAFIEAGEGEGSGYRSFAAIFRGAAPADEAAFERLLWAQLQRLHDLDRARGHDWDPSVSSDPASDAFSFSLRGRAFYVIGMHPGASRMARRFSHPTMVFNAHQQFETLRARGAYGKVRDRIRSNDLTLQGSVNPMLRDHGTSSEAMQYSGRRVGSDWECPFQPRAARGHG